ncbi:hypothetical protein JYG33_16285 [Alcaligenes sp. SORT26]|uniref:hypothetical protein n=1 Tax=Alcaligenes sp. SORT26 TaxID=2813780 RepID=UPI001A9E189E|nr:hypothetical protein [Alcaligenes sp. SORT26]QTB99492.1 hypothetical protein JYG33_16285 [Alcaligenes sp. SORT26]
MQHTAQVVAQNIHSEMAEKARILVIFQRAQEKLKEVLEMPDQGITQGIHSLNENGWQVSGKLKQAYPQLEKQELTEHVVETVRSSVHYSMRIFFPYAMHDIYGTTSRLSF